MIEFHIFEIFSKSFIYLPEYQQAFSIYEKFSELLESSYPNDIRKKELLLSYLTKQLVEHPVFNIDEISNRYALFLMLATTCNANCIYCFAL